MNIIDLIVTIIYKFSWKMFKMVNHYLFFQKLIFIMIILSGFKDQFNKLPDYLFRDLKTPYDYNSIMVSN